MSKTPPATASHDQVVADLLSKRPGLADDYLAAAAEEATDLEGRIAFLQALQHAVKARGSAKVAKAAGIKPQSLSRSLSERGNPTLSTLISIVESAGLKLVLAESPPQPKKTNKTQYQKIVIVRKKKLATAKVMRAKTKKQPSR
jgi:probable addiction module antidote protein